MKELLFLNLIHNLGQNLTVRRGIKWSVEKAADVQGIGPRPIRTLTRKFSDLKDSDLKYEHDDSCRTVGGLVTAMLNAYPEFDTSDIVTLVYYYN